MDLLFLVVKRKERVFFKIYEFDIKPPIRFMLPKNLMVQDGSKLNRILMKLIETHQKANVSN